jgi:hypothetical protein
MVLKQIKIVYAKGESVFDGASERRVTMTVNPKSSQVRNMFCHPWVAVVSVGQFCSTEAEDRIEGISSSLLCVVS